MSECSDGDGRRCAAQGANGRAAVSPDQTRKAVILERLGAQLDYIYELGEGDAEELAGAKRWLAAKQEVGVGVDELCASVIRCAREVLKHE